MQLRKDTELFEIGDLLKYKSSKSAYTARYLVVDMPDTDGIRELRIYKLLILCMQNADLLHINWCVGDVMPISQIWVDRYLVRI
jgi:hypothetical protein